MRFYVLSDRLVSNMSVRRVQGARRLGGGRYLAVRMPNMKGPGSGFQLQPG